MNNYITKISNPIEKIEKEGRLNKFSHKTKASDMRGWIQGWISTHARKGNMDMVFVFQEVLKAYNHFEPEKKVEVDVDSWHGKSSFEIIKGIDKLIIVKYQKREKGSEPQEVKTEVHKVELQGLIDSIRFVSKKGIEEMETKDLAFQYCYLMGYNEMLNGDFWKNFFSNRKLHNKFTLMLGALDKLGLIEYKGGKTKLLNKDISIQLVLE